MNVFQGVFLKMGLNLLIYMAKRSISSSKAEIYVNPLKITYDTNKTDVYYLDIFSSLNMLDLSDYGPKNNKGCKNVLVTIDNFTKFEWTIP